MIVKKVKDLFKKSMVMERDFDIDHDYKNDETKMAPIKIVRGRYKGVTFCFGKISIPEKENSDGTYTLNFDYDMLNAGKHDAVKLANSQAFTDTLGAILNSIILAGIEREKTNDDKVGNDYSEELDTKRRVRKKGASVPK